MNVEGMSCGHCNKAIGGSVGKLVGVSHVKVHLNRGVVDVKYNSSELTLDKINETIKDEGYEVK